MCQSLFFNKITGKNINKVSRHQMGALIVNTEHTHLTKLLLLWLTLNLYLPGGLSTKACSNLTKKET